MSAEEIHRPSHSAAMVFQFRHFLIDAILSKLPLETIRGQRDYLADMLRQVGANIQGGKIVEKVIEEVHLSQYQPFGAEPRRTAGQVRSMYRKLAANRRQ